MESIIDGQLSPGLNLGEGCSNSKQFETLIKHSSLHKCQYSKEGNATLNPSMHPSMSACSILRTWRSQMFTFTLHLQIINGRNIDFKEYFEYHFSCESKLNKEKQIWLETLRSCVVGCQHLQNDPVQSSSGAPPHLILFLIIRRLAYSFQSRAFSFRQFSRIPWISRFPSTIFIS